MTPPSLATLARRVLDGASVPSGATVLVACSGGLDSQVLLDVLAHVATQSPRGRRTTQRVRLVACGVNHGLRPEAGEELAKAEALAALRGVPFRKVAVHVGRGSNVQARAREARWAVLRDVARDVRATHIATGHHRDDRAETVLIRILRGAPLEALAVLPPHDRDVLRPLVDAPRARLEVHAQERGLSWSDDPSNRDPRHLRARVRHDVLPLLRSLDPRVDEHLVALAERAAECPHDPLATLGRTTRASTRALAALRDAARRNVQAEVALPSGRSARWDPRGTLVIRENAGADGGASEAISWRDR